MASLAAQLAVQALTCVGAGYWMWLACGRPRSTRGLTWLWCGLAGFAVHVHVLQALVYLDVPISSSAPWAGASVALGVLLAIRNARRFWGRQRVELLTVALVILTAAGSISFATWHHGPDRFLARAQPDQLNYVLMAQGLADEKFSLDNREIGLRPWLYRTMELKHQRLTQCVVLAHVAVMARTDCQRAWFGVSVGFVGLLAAALFGLARNLGGLPLWLAGLAAIAGAGVPAVGVMFLNGYFSQLGTLWTFPALLALGRPAAVTRRTRMLCMAAIGGYLAGAYTEFFPIGAAMGVMMLLAAHAPWRGRVMEAAMFASGALLLTTGYLRDAGRFFATQLAAASQPEFLSAIAGEGGTWQGWSRHFFAGSVEVSGWAGAFILALALAGMLLARRHRRRWWLVAFSAPLAVLLYFFLQPELPAYAFQKLGAALAPIVAVLAVTGCARGLASSRPAVRAAAGTFATAVAAGVIVGGIAALDSWTPTPIELLWRARERVETSPAQTYLIARGHHATAGWLAYFARASSVYLDLPAISDRRVPSESQAFRRIPPDKPLVWLDLERTGPVASYEATPEFAMHGALAAHTSPTGRVYQLGAVATIVIERNAAAGLGPRSFELELGLTPADGARTIRVAFVAENEPRRTWQISSPTLLAIPLALAPGANRFELSCQAGDQRGDGVVALVQSISLNRVDPLP